MKMQELSYKPYGVGSWTHVTVSEDVAQALAHEYLTYGWEVRIDNIPLKNELIGKAV
ncbi:hypothetical protein ACFFUO_03475 [Vibrio artabrorum]|uniref:Uncharacterized protein n=1 Tax=Vibrio artabrorum TaxID=446374 RepID=A0ABT8CMC2_9VIBR|nr:hypothetical protein [Vibrio artabrorum]MDN3702574.1 hypothetical protein [Vibrio artabrorum]